MIDLRPVKDSDLELYEVLAKELKRQQEYPEEFQLQMLLEF